MGERTAISWCDHTFNPWVGCTKVSPACDRCYAESWAKRTGQSQLWRGERRRTSETTWKSPVTWNKWAARDGVRRRVFCASLADVFDNQIPAEWRADLWRLIAGAPILDWLLLTKRPQNIVKMLPPNWGDGYPHVWLGTTVENQGEANRRIPHLLAAPARVRFLSCEPLLDILDLWLYLDPCQVFRRRVNWVICGGESGGRARPMNLAWARSLRDQCAEAGVPFHFKQWGGLRPESGGCALDGREHKEFPVAA
jgi:protein gp37